MIKKYTYESLIKDPYSKQPSFYDIAPKQFIRNKYTNNTNALPAPPSNKQWGYLYIAYYYFSHKIKVLLVTNDFCSDIWAIWMQNHDQDIVLCSELGMCVIHVLLLKWSPHA